ncbi:PEP/pyruvate-binding domain-containing protein [Ilyobacter polytropus]|uniref:Phosphoenolpyruvate synthase n=1 Tax=Ilyobacter polytropus (strain ATCC 51220 / DSM 2926 / LMG 16218 / CuHBu1) TaxID=572544 RepID=E3HCX0_ILYPC|nr:PEP/pyruvate-binding domain-containing protein [Ilyobacter polytropus]ADO84026.1 pyruvate phosphate dikinase PEP/pyruvate-binding protein [Ilyobacter polytropus DSM 2926]
MMIPIKEIRKKDLPKVGEKAYNLSKLKSSGYLIPDGISIIEGLYRNFINETGLIDKIRMELARRELSAMRWEELWDTSLRIRNLFLRTEIPKNIYIKLRQGLSGFSDIPVVVRSSAPGEDSSNSSFAGLHESYVDIKGIDNIITHIKLVWASLWSDRALLYRKELGLDPWKSSMGVIVQELITGQVSGVAFSRDPTEKYQMVIEAVPGLNQDLVDGKIEPERWMLDIENGSIKERYSNKKTSLLDERELNILYNTLKNLHEEYKFPIDLEWTIKDNKVYLLQVRPITTLTGEGGEEKLWEKEDKRPWYRSLTKSFDTLKDMQRRIEEEILPDMEKAAAYMKNMDISSIDYLSLSKEILRRIELYEKWHNIYWQELIPFAHGVRLFGKIYNDAVKPTDPYEFTELLKSDNMISVTRNRSFLSLIKKIKDDPVLYEKLKNKIFDDTSLDFFEALDFFMHHHGNSSYRGDSLLANKKDVLRLILNMADIDIDFEEEYKDISDLENKFLSAFKIDQQDFAKDILNLARISWRIRDDDNIYLGKLESALLDSVNQGKIRLSINEKVTPYTVAMMLADPDYSPRVSVDTKSSPLPSNDKQKRNKLIKIATIDKNSEMRMRKFTGQPAGPGIGIGKSRVIQSQKDIFLFKKGEVLVCDAIDPNMTFIVQFASAIVERRGGMLIHGAIIAREYGIPCVTGIDNATEIIETGVTLVVDGYTGTVTIKET